MPAPTSPPAMAPAAAPAAVWPLGVSPGSWLCVPTPPPTPPGIAPRSPDVAMHAGRSSMHPLNATATITPPTVNLTSRLMRLSLSRLSPKPSAIDKAR